jgi:hypothetical protein
MPGEALPEPESCLHNVHRISDRRDARPEPTDLCRNAIGVFHMADCPLAIGIACVYHEAAPSPHPTTGDADVEVCRDDLRRDFLGWRYRRRVRWLTKPRNLVPTPIVVEAAQEPEEVVPETLALRAPPPEVAPDASVQAPPPGGSIAPAAAAPNAGAASGSPVSDAPAPPSAPELYPGQRRSEERLARKKAKIAERQAAAAAAKAARLAAAVQSVAADDESDEDEAGDGSGPGTGDEDQAEGDAEDGPEDEDGVPAEPTGPRTVEQVLAALPDAPAYLPVPPRDGRPRQGGPARRRRRRGRRGRVGRGPGPGQGP